MTDARPTRPSAPRYHARGWNLLAREVRAFGATAFGSLVTREFLTLLIPLLLIWEALPRLGLVPATLLPPFTQVCQRGWEVMTQGHQAFPLWAHLGSSVWRLFLGLSLAIVLGFSIGVLMGWNLFIRRHLLPLIQLLAPVPPPAWVPITIIALGIGVKMQMFLIFIGAFYPIVLNTYQGVKDTDPRYLASARVFGASEWTLIRSIYIPHALGAVVMGVKIGIAMALVMLVIAEPFGSNIGVGYMLHITKEHFDTAGMIVCMLMLGFIGWFLIEVMKYLEAKLALWRGGR